MIESALVTIQVSQAGQDVLYGAIILFMAYFNQLAVSGPGRPRSLRGSLGAFRGWLEPVGAADEPLPAPELADGAADRSLQR